jgi:serine/threonine protein kinase
MVDLWATGCIAFEALTGNPLFPAQGEGDLLLQMCCVLGSPPVGDKHFSKMMTYFDARLLPRQYPALNPRTWFEHGKFSEDAVHCIASLVRWVPETRKDCLTALRTEPFLRML